MTGSGAVQADTPIRSIAVLPFDTSATDQAEKFLGVSLPDLLITRLSNVRHLVVRPTSAVREFAGRHLDSRQIGRDLKVDTVLEGSIRTSPDRIRVTVQLLNVRDQKPIWAERFDEKRVEMFEIEDKISERVAEALTGRLAPNERTILAKRYTSNPVAYELYVQGRYQLQEAAFGDVRRKRAGEFFLRAVEADNQYALAWAGLSQMYSWMALWDEASPRDALPKAEAAALKALQLDDDLSEAHCAAAAVRLLSYHDFAGAEREFLRALELNPRNTTALTWYAFFLTCMQRFDEAIAVYNRQIEVDPVSSSVQQFLANTYFTARRYDRSIQLDLMVLKMNPNDANAHADLARACTLRGDHEGAIAHGRKAVEISEGARSLAFLGYALAMAGRKAEANNILRNLKERPEQELVSPFLLAIVDLGLGDQDAALLQLEKTSSDDVYGLRLKVEPILDPLRSNPRFTAVLRRAGFRS
jgi:TolB-like protein/Flp pilus assembly protein TadD